MDEKNAWEIFCRTGMVNDYINFANVRQTEEEREKDGEIHNRRTDNSGK